MTSGGNLIGAVTGVAGIGIPIGYPLEVGSGSIIKLSRGFGVLGFWGFGVLLF